MLKASLLHPNIVLLCIQQLIEIWKNTQTNIAFKYQTQPLFREPFSTAIYDILTLTVPKMPHELFIHQFSHFFGIFLKFSNFTNIVNSTIFDKIKKNNAQSFDFIENKDKSYLFRM